MRENIKRPSNPRLPSLRLYSPDPSQVARMSLKLNPHEYEEMVRATSTIGYSPVSIKTDRASLNPSCF